MERLFTLRTVARLMLLTAAISLSACGAPRSPIEEEFLARSLDYPVHIASPQLEVPKLVNPGGHGERQAPEFQDLFASGWQSFLALPLDEFARQYCSTAEAFEFGDPILFENDGHIDFGVTLTCYGRTEPPHRATWEDDHAYWKSVNIALFRNERDTWSMDGWVY